MDSSGMDYTMQHPNHHHPHYHHPGSASSSISASRCPAFRAAAEQHNYQLPAVSPPRGSVQYDPVHGHAGNRNVWQSRSPQNWRPAMISPYTPYTQDTLMMGSYPGPTLQNQQPQPQQPQQQQQQYQHQNLHQQQPQQQQQQPQQHQQPPCPMPTTSNVPNLPEGYSSQIPPFQQFRPTMHPLPHFLPQSPYQNSGGFGNSGPSHPITQHSSNRPSHRAVASLTSVGSAHASVPPLQIPASRSSAAQAQMGQTTSFANENVNPGQHLPNLPHLFTRQSNTPRFSHHTPEPVAQAANPLAEDNSRPASHSPPAPASTAPQRTNDQPIRMTNPVEIRRASNAAMARARRSMPRFAGTSSEWLSENAILFRRGDMSLVEFVESFPGAIPDGEGPMPGRFLRGHGSGKRVASKKALASLQSVNIVDLPESERTCVICYNDFGVANPEGINEAPLRLPKCKHVFGDHCIKKWFQESDSCPYCRDKVHSEFQIIPARRTYPGFRFIPPYSITAQHLPGYQGHDQNQSRDRDAAESESSTQVRQSMTNSTTDRPSNQFSDIGPSNRSPPGNRRVENNHHHGLRMTTWNTYERRSPPIEFDRRRRPRHRARVTSPSTRPSAFGGPTSNSASQTSVRPSRSSRSRSPFDPTSTGLDSGSRRSLTSSPEQYPWNVGLSPNSNQTGVTMTSSPPSGPVFDASSFPFHSRMNGPSDEFFHGVVSPNTDVMPTNEHPSELPQIRPDPARFSSPSTESLDIYSGHANSNPFTSYQQS
ncbi:hypothetical protein GGS24DRAFT_500064 [Hypoxylon argillaceum]|nr:hypothetical protein GGS24DRAFT_500064 [Hypoxylon argillaceum]